MKNQVQPQDQHPLDRYIEWTECEPAGSEADAVEKLIKMGKENDARKDAFKKQIKNRWRKK